MLQTLEVQYISQYHVCSPSLPNETLTALSYRMHIMNNIDDNLPASLLQHVCKGHSTPQISRVGSYKQTSSKLNICSPHAPPRCLSCPCPWCKRYRISGSTLPGGRGKKALRLHLASHHPCLLVNCDPPDRRLHKKSKPQFMSPHLASLKSARRPPLGNYCTS